MTAETDELLPVTVTEVGLGLCFWRQVLPGEGSEKMLVQVLLFSPAVHVWLLLLFVTTVRCFVVLKRND
jgi:hypothetical protein